MLVGDLVACEHLYGLILKTHYGVTYTEVLVYWLNNQQTDGTYPKTEWCPPRYLIKIQ